MSPPISAYSMNRPSSSKEKKTSKSLEVEKSLRQKKNVGRELGAGWFLCVSFFLAPRIGALFIFIDVGTSIDVRLGLVQDGWGSLLTQMAGTNAKLRAKPQHQ